MVKKDNILRGWMSDIHCTCQQTGLLFSLSKKKKGLLLATVNGKFSKLCFMTNE